MFIPSEDHAIALVIALLARELGKRGNIWTEQAIIQALKSEKWL